MSNYIERPIYMDKLWSYKEIGGEQIKVVTGIRRCGKSTLLNMFVEKLKQNGVDEKNIIHINFESLRYSQITGYRELYDYVTEKTQSSGKMYLVFDEIQNVEGWEKAVDSFMVDMDCDIYITGSNAYMLSGELATKISGRYVELRMLPLSFEEFLRFYEFAPDMSKDEKFTIYMRRGGMPTLKWYDFEDGKANEVLVGIYSTVVLKDVVEHNNITDIAMMEKLSRFLADNIGNRVSPNSIAGALINAGNMMNGKRTTAKTVDNYIGMLEKAYIFTGVSRYDIKGKDFLKTLKKYYICDMGLRNMLLGYRDIDRGHALENVVYHELIRRGYRVSIGKYDDVEIDFIAETQSDKKYIQVTETMLGEETRKRELSPLIAIDDNYEKIVLTRDYSEVSDYNGIKVVNVVEWLLNKN